MKFRKKISFYFILTLLLLLFPNCSEDRDNEVMIRLICINSDFSGSYVKNSEPSVSIDLVNNTNVGDVYSQDIPLSKVNSLTVTVTAIDDFTTKDIRIRGYIIEDNEFNDEADQVDSVAGGDKATITLELN